MSMSRKLKRGEVLDNVTARWPTGGKLDMSSTFSAFDTDGTSCMYSYLKCVYHPIIMFFLVEIWLKM